MVVYKNYPFEISVEGISTLPDFKTALLPYLRKIDSVDDPDDLYFQLERLGSFVDDKTDFIGLLFQLKNDRILVMDKMKIYAKNEDLVFQVLINQCIFIVDVIASIKEQYPIFVWLTVF